MDDPDQDDIDTDPGMGPMIRLDLSDADIDDFLDDWESDVDGLNWGGATNEHGVPVKVKPPRAKAISLKEQRKKDGLCPECGSRGEWRNVALVCPEHGRFMG